jgi:hypothetical protein
MAVAVKRFGESRPGAVDVRYRIAFVTASSDCTRWVRQ